jgi:hypothetical protein
MTKKVYTIYPRTKDAQENGLLTSKGRRVSFKGKTMINTTSKELVEEVEAQPLEAYAVHDEQFTKARASGQWDVTPAGKLKLTHNYFFGSSNSPEAEKFWRRYKRKQKKKGKV